MIVFDELDSFAAARGRYEGGSLPAGARIDGPAIVREPTTTVVVYPGSAAVVTPLGNYLLELAPDDVEAASIEEEEALVQ